MENKLIKNLFTNDSPNAKDNIEMSNNTNNSSNITTSTSNSSNTQKNEHSLTSIFQNVHIKTKEEEQEDKMNARDPNKKQLTNFNIDKLRAGIESLKLSKQNDKRDQEFSKRRNLKKKLEEKLVTITQKLSISLITYNHMQSVTPKFELYNKYYNKIVHGENNELTFEGLVMVRKIFCNGKILNLNIPNITL